MKRMDMTFKFYVMAFLILCPALVATWIFGGICISIAANSYAEPGTVITKADRPYVFARETYDTFDYADSANPILVFSASGSCLSGFLEKPEIFH